jgi:uncharacterized membrane protein
MIRRDALREYSRGSLWLLPSVAVIVALIAGGLLSRVNVGAESVLAFQGTADDARNLLIGITGTMVTVIALLLGLAVVALQLSSTQFSPRLLRNFLRDRPNQVVLSVFVGTFAYAAGGLFEVGVSGGQRVDEYPRFAMTIAIVLLFLSLALLVFFADHLAHSLQVDHILRVVERSTLPVIADLPDTEELPTVPPRAIAVPARTSGYVQVVHLDQLLAAAVAHGMNVRLRPRVGEHITAGTPLAWIWPTPARSSARSLTTSSESFVAALDGAVRIGFERTLEQDPALGFRQLVDPACKALSPAVNDPYTAIQAVEHMSVLFAALAARPAGPLVVHDVATGTTVGVPARTFAEHLAVGIGPIRRFGASEPTVIRTLLRLLSTTLYACGEDPDRWAAIECEMDLLTAAAERETVERADLAPVHAEADALREALAARRAGAARHEPADTGTPESAPPT